MCVFELSYLWTSRRVVQSSVAPLLILEVSPETDRTEDVATFTDTDRCVEKFATDGTV